MPIDNTRTNQHEADSCNLLVDKFFAYYTHNNIFYDTPAKEFCDAVVIFEDYNIVFQMKRSESGNIDNYNKLLKHGIGQLIRNKKIIRKRVDLRVGASKNSPQFDMPFGSKTFYILLMDGMWEYLDPNSSEEKYKTLMTDDRYKYLREETHYSDFIDANRINNDFFIFNDYAQFEKTLRHCSTIKDFIHYLEFKRDLVHGGARGVIAPHDEAILSWFILGDRNILNNLDDKTFLIFDDRLTLNDDRIHKKLRGEEVSYAVVDKNLIELFYKHGNDNGLGTNAEIALREIIALNRQQRLGLTNRCLDVQESERFLAMFWQDDRKTLYCISDYGERRRKMYGHRFENVEEYIMNILYPVACYKINQQGERFDKKIFIVYGRKKDNLIERTLLMTLNEAAPDDIELGKKLEEGLQLKMNHG